jgi:hypothetical protein
VPAQGKECFSTGRARSATDQSRSPPILEDYPTTSTVRLHEDREKFPAAADAAACPCPIGHRLSNPESRREETHAIRRMGCSISPHSGHGLNTGSAHMGLSQREAQAEPVRTADRVLSGASGVLDSQHRGHSRSSSHGSIVYRSSLAAGCLRRARSAEHARRALGV